MGAVEALGGLLEDRLENTLGIVIQLSVPHPQNRPTFLREEGIATNVVRTTGVLAAVQFKDELGLAARKVGDVGPDR